MPVKLPLKLASNSWLMRHDCGRRAFIANLTKAVGATILLSAPGAGLAKNLVPGNRSWTVGQIMDRFIQEVPGGALKNTVDTLKAGSRDIPVTGIITTMFATLEVIQKAIASGANFIIAHEPTFYNHLDETDWLQKDEVYRYKAELLKKHNIAVWRNHDYIHRLVPDGVRTPVLKQLGWEKYYNATTPELVAMPAVSLKELIQQVKKRLGLSAVRYIGDLSQPCRSVLLMPGMAGGKRQIEAIMKTRPDVILCGEISEWETAEYVRDARTKGQPLSLVVMGHVASEEPGSAFLASWLQEKVPEIKTTHIPANNSLSFM